MAAAATTVEAAVAIPESNNTSGTEYKLKSIEWEPRHRPIKPSSRFFAIKFVHKCFASGPGDFSVELYEDEQSFRFPCKKFWDHGESQETEHMLSAALSSIGVPESEHTFIAAAILFFCNSLKGSLDGSGVSEGENKEEAEAEAEEPLMVVVIEAVTRMDFTAMATAIDELVDDDERGFEMRTAIAMAESASLYAEANYGNKPAARSALDVMVVKIIPGKKNKRETASSDEFVFGEEEEDEDEVQGQCMICLENLDRVAGTGAGWPKRKRVSVREMPCKHKFHEDCIFKWLETRNFCPLCRYELPEEDNLN